MWKRLIRCAMLFLLIGLTAPVIAQDKGGVKIGVLADTCPASMPISAARETRRKCS